MNLPRILLLAWAGFTGSLCGEPAVALLAPGETLVYRTGWGLLGNAGEIRITATGETRDGRECVRVTTSTATRGLVRALYPFNGDAWTLFDAQDGRLLSGSATTRSAKHSTHATITFDYPAGRADYVDHLLPARSVSVPLPEAGMPVDLITALIQARRWELAPGRSQDALVLFDDEFYPLRITAEREETIATPKGPRKTLLLLPRMPENPKGMFRRGGEVRVWISADEARLPLRFEVKLKVGTAYAILTDYQPPVP